MNLDEVYKPIAGELQVVVEALRRSMSDTSNGDIRTICQELVEPAAKHIRPALVLLCGKAAWAAGDSGAAIGELENLAVAVELIHISSLIHDDVIDRASMRHGHLSTNVRWGDKIATLLGDYIFSKAFVLVCGLGDPDVFSLVGETTSMMCEGEMTQVEQRNNRDLSTERYLEIAGRKTGSLFAVCCHSAAAVVGCSDEVQMALGSYGVNLGTAFQLSDDCMDVIADPQDMGKRPGQDMFSGDMTLLLLNLFATGSGPEIEELLNTPRESLERPELEVIRGIVIESGALQKTQECISSFTETAKTHLNVLADSEFRDSLALLADSVAHRTKVEIER